MPVPLIDAEEITLKKYCGILLFQFHLATRKASITAHELSASIKLYIGTLESVVHSSPRPPDDPKPGFFDFILEKIAGIKSGDEYQLLYTSSLKALEKQYPIKDLKISPSIKGAIAEIKNFITKYGVFSSHIETNSRCCQLVALFTLATAVVPLMGFASEIMAVCETAKRDLALKDEHYRATLTQCRDILFQCISSEPLTVSIEGPPPLHVQDPSLNRFEKAKFPSTTFIKQIMPLKILLDQSLFSKNVDPVQRQNAEENSEHKQSQNQR